MTRTLTMALLLSACSGEPAETDPATDTAASDVPEGHPFCNEKGLPTAVFQTTDGAAALGEIAGDFTLSTRESDEDWVFSEQFTGCTSYVFFVHFPGINDAPLSSNFEALFEDAPANVEYFFLSNADDRPSRNAYLDSVEAEVESALASVFRKEEKRALWRSRVHLVSKQASGVSGSLGDFVTEMVRLAYDPDARVDLGDRGMAPVPLPEVFGIDRGQRFDAGGSLSPYVGAPSDQIGMAVWLAHFYDYRHALDTRMSEETGVTVVPIMDEVTTGRTFTLPAQLPDADTMATFDTLEIDVTVDCLYVNPFACSEWDRIAAIYWCEDGESCSTKREITRWVTPYWRRGRQRYALKASPMLGLMQAGGEQYFHVALGPNWERATEWHAIVSLRLSDAGGPRPVAAVPAFVGGTFDESYNEREPVAFTPPAGATRTEVVTIISGHGQDGSNRCAEWCDHRHTFSVDGTDLETIQHEGPISDGLGCARLSNQGVMPGQWGNWSQTRPYWCPGMEVPVRTLDITDAVSAGQESQLGYRASHIVGDPAGGSISLASYVVFYQDP